MTDQSLTAEHIRREQATTPPTKPKASPTPPTKPKASPTPPTK